MKVKLINEYLDSYTAFLSSKQILPQSYLWHLQDHFVAKWDIEELNFEEMFDHSFKSNTSQRLWKRENYFPKEMILKLVKLERETMRSIFKDLLNENKDLNLRVNRFLHHIDQMLQVIQRKDRQASTHFHGDLKFVFVYLAFCYPEAYTLYDETNFLRYLEKVEARNIPRNHNPILFSNLMKATRRLLLKNESFLKEKERLAEENNFSLEVENLWVFDFYNFVATGDGKHEKL